ncbi:exit protein of rhodopsin and TRP A [Cotesia typhae]
MVRRDRIEKPDKEEKKLATVEEEEKDLNQGFGDWLRSTDGVEMMRLFVITNSLLVFVTIGWPNIQQTWSIIKDYVMGEEEE